MRWGVRTMAWACTTRRRGPSSGRWRCASEAMGPDDPLTLASRNDVALAYDKAGRVNDAIAILEPTLKLMEARLRPEHPDTLASRNNLAMAYQQVGRVDDPPRCTSGRSDSWSPRWAPSTPTRSPAATISPRSTARRAGCPK